MNSLEPCIPYDVGEPMIMTNGLTEQTKSLQAYLISLERTPLFLPGNAVALLATFPSSCIDCALTSPPYWGQRAYASGGIGLEETWQEYVDNLLSGLSIKFCNIEAHTFWTPMRISMYTN